MLKSNTPLVSVGIPCYNRSVGIPRYNKPEGLDSLLHDITSQTYTNLEIIISDNFSPYEKEMQAVIAKYIDDPRIKYIRQKENIGAAENFTFVLQQSSGEYFMWAADDDWYEPEFIEKTVSLLENNDKIALAFTGFCNCATDKTPLRFFNNIYLLGKSSGRMQFLRFLYQHEQFGKANLICGLFRANKLKEVFLSQSWDVPPESWDALFGDILFLTAFLSKYNFSVVDNTVLFFKGAPIIREGNKLTPILCGTSNFYPRIVTHSDLFWKSLCVVQSSKTRIRVGVVLLLRVFGEISYWLCRYIKRIVSRFFRILFLKRE